MRAYVNGRIRTGDASNPWADALVVDDQGALLHVGSADRVDAGIPRADLEGDVVVPGFIDAHVHPKMAGAQLLDGTLAGLATVGDYWRVLRERLARTPDGWVVLTGYSAMVMARSGATRRTLDLISGSRPVLLVNSDLHGGLGNTAALDAAGLLRGGTFSSELVEVDAGGNATGYLNEEALSSALGRVPASTESQLIATLEAAQSHLHSRGVVGWQDAGVGDAHGHGDPLPLYLALIARGGLTARVSAAHAWDRGRGVEQLADILEHRDDAAARGLALPAVKLFLDGVNEAHTAAMLHPYNDAAGHVGDDGPSLIDREALIGAVIAIDAAGLDVHMHAVGDRAVRDGLDAIAAARRENGSRPTRQQIAHALFVSDEDVPRFAELDVTLNVQPVWSAPDFLDFPGYRAMVGDAVLRTLYRFETLHATGLRWSIGSDWPVSSPAPLDAITAGARRALHAETAKATDASLERLAPEILLAAATAGSAYSSRLESNGVLRSGMNADFVRLSADPVEAPWPNEVTVLETVVGGRTVFRSGD